MIEFILVNDISKLANLASEIWNEYWVDILSKEQISYMVKKFQSESAIKDQIANDNYSYFFILKNKEAVGYIGISKKEDYLFLSKLYIKSQWCHLGIGTQAFSFLKEQAKVFGYNKIILTVNKNNLNTIRAYKKWGFETIESVETDIGCGFIMDDYIMQYKFT